MEQKGEQNKEIQNGTRMVPEGVWIGGEIAEKRNHRI